MCTSTLEMGIDIGSMESVAQVGVPPSVAALRQRVGRSGRRDEPARLRMTLREIERTPKITVQDALRLQLTESMAMLELMLRGYTEASPQAALHLSTLVQQTLSVLAQYGGMTAPRLYALLCRNAPFANVDTASFAQFLKDLHAHELVQQMPDGVLLVGLVGERLINNYTFYAAFNTPEEYRLISDGKTLGTLPIENPLLPDAYLVYAGRRWKVVTVDEMQKVAHLTPASGGRPPAFGGHGVWVEAPVRAAMRLVYESDSVPVYLDSTAKALLTEGRETFAQLNLSSARIVSDAGSSLLFLWTSDRIAETIKLALYAQDLKAMGDGICLSIDQASPQDVRDGLSNLLRHGFPTALGLASQVPNKATEKHDLYIGEALLTREYAARFLDVEGAAQVLETIVNRE